MKALGLCRMEYSCCFFVSIVRQRGILETERGGKIRGGGGGADTETKGGRDTHKERGGRGARGDSVETATESDKDRHREIHTKIHRETETERNIQTERQRKTDIKGKQGEWMDRRREKPIDTELE